MSQLWFSNQNVGPTSSNYFCTWRIKAQKLGFNVIVTISFGISVFVNILSWLIRILVAYIQAGKTFCKNFKCDRMVECLTQKMRNLSRLDSGPKKLWNICRSLESIFMRGGLICHLETKGQIFKFLKVETKYYITAVKYLGLNVIGTEF